MVPRAPITTGTVVVLSPHIRSTSSSKSLYLVSFFVVLTELLVSRGVVVSVRRQVLSFLFFTTMSGLLAAMVLSVWMVMFHSIVTLSFSVTVLGSCSYLAESLGLIIMRGRCVLGHVVRESFEA